MLVNYQPAYLKELLRDKNEFEGGSKSKLTSIFAVLLVTFCIDVPAEPDRSFNEPLLYELVPKNREPKKTDLDTRTN